MFGATMPDARGSVLFFAFKRKDGRSHYPLNTEKEQCARQGWGEAAGDLEEDQPSWWLVFRPGPVSRPPLAVCAYYG
jgi:hypothetical protein